jgi:hypothetical protein
MGPQKLAESHSSDESCKRDMSYEALEKIINSDPNAVELFNTVHGEDLIAETICAFSNSDGGHLVFGVRRGPVVKGVRLLEYNGVLETSETNPLLERCKKKVNPAVSADCSRIQHNGKKYLVLPVPGGGGIVHRTLTGDVWVRRGGENERISYFPDLIEFTAPTSLEADLSQILASTTPESVSILDAKSVSIFIDTVSAFSNTNGGTILIGCNKNVLNTVPTLDVLGSIVGISSAESQRLLHTASFILAPSPDMKISAYSVASDGASWPAMLIIRVSAKSDTRVINLEDGYVYLRKGSRNFRVDDDGIGGDESGGIDSPAEIRDPLASDSKETEADRIAALENSRARVIGAKLGAAREASANEEALNIDQHAQVLVDFLTTAAGDVCFGLFGHWGRGKTFLVGKVTNILERDFNYRSVRFSAWKYRSRPGVWAHLYETTLEEQRSCGFVAVVTSACRSAVARVGALPIIFAVVGFGVALFPLGGWIHLLSQIFRATGLLSLAYLLIIALKSDRVRRFTLNAVRQPTHRDELGLQAAIGDDLRFLLLGWVSSQDLPPKAQSGGVESGSADESRKSISLFSFMRQLTCREKILCGVYFAATLFVGYQLDLSTFQKLDRVLFDLPEGMPYDYSVWVVRVAWFALSLLLPLVSFLYCRGPRRLLLVIDDLDRCEPLQMLEIIESVMLLLHDTEIQRRLQVMMLVEEQSVRAALLIKYQHLRSRPAESAEFDPLIDNRIFRENIEKLFISYLRLPEIPADDFRELLLKYMHGGDGQVDPRRVAGDVGRPSSSTSAAASSVGFGNDAAFPSGALNGSEESEAGAAEVRSEMETSAKTIQQISDLMGLKNVEEKALKLSADERQLLQNRLEALRASPLRDVRLGPRAVRSYILKYRLARALWMALHPGEPFDSRSMIDALIPIDRAQATTKDPAITYIVSQVK